MLKIAIVGNIASGKSTVEKILIEQGYSVYDADKIAHNILAKSEKIKEVFGTIDRKEIAKIVFADVNKLKLLESIIHPEVKKSFQEIFESDLNVVFISVPQLFEAGFESLFDKVIYITADEHIRKERLIKRNSYSLEEAQRRIDAQIEIGKKEKSDFVIENNSSIEDLTTQVLEMLSVLVG